MIPGQDLCQTFVNASPSIFVGIQAFPLHLRAVKATASELKHCQDQILTFRFSGFQIFMTCSLLRPIVVAFEVSV